MTPPPAPARHHTHARAASLPRLSPGCQHFYFGMFVMWMSLWKGVHTNEVLGNVNLLINLFLFTGSALK